MADDTTWLGLLITGGGLALALSQYRMNSLGAAQMRQRERAIKIADELEKFHDDPSVRLALEILDYNGAELPPPMPTAVR